MATVSIITATYNRSEVLRWAIASARGQTRQDWELIIVGDACTDDTAEVVASFGDPRVRFVNRDENFGEQSGPNNDGFAMASGQYIAYLNHDDLWFPDHLESLVRHIEGEGADLVYALPVGVDSHGMFFCSATNAELRYDPSHLVPASLWLARRGLIAELGGWRDARAVDARNPSQDLLFRAWQRTRSLRCHPAITALLLASGGRPRCYLTRDDHQHRALFLQMQDSGFRERLATTLALQTAREVERLRGKGWGRAFQRWIDRLLIFLRLHPDAARNRLARRRRGWWIEQLRAMRGLPPLPTPTRLACTTGSSQANPMSNRLPPNGGWFTRARCPE